jgi:hypothetical protein
MLTFKLLHIIHDHLHISFNVALLSHLDRIFNVKTVKRTVEISTDHYFIITRLQSLNSAQ